MDGLELVRGRHGKADELRRAIGNGIVRMAVVMEWCEVLFKCSRNIYWLTEEGCLVGSSAKRRIVAEQVWIRTRLRCTLGSGRGHGESARLCVGCCCLRAGDGRGAFSSSGP